MIAKTYKLKKMKGNRKCNIEIEFRLLSDYMEQKSKFKQIEEEWEKKLKDEREKSKLKDDLEQKKLKN